MILIHTGIGIVLVLENAFQIIGRHLHAKSPCFCHAPHPCKERISYQLFRSCIVVLGFFDTEGRICSQRAFSAVEQIIPLIPVRLLVEGGQEKKVSLAGEALVHSSLHSGRLCRCLLPLRKNQKTMTKCNFRNSVL